MIKASKNSHFSPALSARHILSGSAVMMTSLMLPSLAQAHSGHIHSATMQAPSFLGTLQAGLMHPVTGLDHLFLAVGMGMLFYGLQKQRLGMMSLTAGLSLGAVLGTIGVLIGGVGFAASSGLIEVVISLSVVVLAMILMSDKSRQEAFFAQTHTARTPSIQQLSLFGFGGLAVFHGLAHALEVPANAGVSGQLGFYAGMLVTMLALYSVGTLISQQLQQRLGDNLWIQRGLVVLGLGAVFVPAFV
ncbi:HupE/UreJ family protein [Psychrobacter sp. Ps6]|uniref:HupE/UreJ family protein n=1 Tax=Psychrobacter sp. Ps6 TaxID=2790960 RepID=UPI001EE09343|nr:HupE/UreJ family protein [Psychrobacter sp. Ps6]MCG3880220.1 HupE/UreJ family protein [Psychrobacter sp. Ps6]